MSEASVIAYECPGCGKNIEPGEDYVVAREYPLTARLQPAHTRDMTTWNQSDDSTSNTSGDAGATTSTN